MIRQLIVNVYFIELTTRRYYPIFKLCMMSHQCFYIKSLRLAQAQYQLKALNILCHLIDKYTLIGRAPQD